MATTYDGSAPANPPIGGINTLVQLIDYIKRQLGSPLSNVEVTPEQMMDAINDTVLMFVETADVGVVEKFAILDTSGGGTEFQLPGNVQSVIEVVTPTNDGTGGDFLFSTYNILFQDGLLNPGMLIGSLSYLQTVREYMALTEFMLKKVPLFDFNPITRKIRLMEPADTFLGLRVWEALDPTVDTSLYGHTWIRRMSTARVKRQWGQNLSKFTHSLPGAAQLNGDAILSQGEQEIEKLETELEEKYSAPADFIVA